MMFRSSFQRGTDLKFLRPHHRHLFMGVSRKARPSHFFGWHKLHLIIVIILRRRLFREHLEVFGLPWSGHCQASLLTHDQRWHYLWARHVNKADSKQKSKKLPWHCCWLIFSVEARQKQVSTSEGELLRFCWQRYIPWLPFLSYWLLNDLNVKSSVSLSSKVFSHTPATPFSMAYHWSIVYPWLWAICWAASVLEGQMWSDVVRCNQVLMKISCQHVVVQIINTKLSII